MSLTSYRAAPPRVKGEDRVEVFVWVCMGCPVGRPGGDLLSHVLRRSTIGAEGFHGRVRDGIGCSTPRCDHQVSQPETRAPRRAGFGNGVTETGDVFQARADGRGPWGGSLVHRRSSR